MTRELNIVERLREYARNCGQAADEIERLQAAYDSRGGEMNSMREALAEAQQLIEQLHAEKVEQEQEWAEICVERERLLRIEIERLQAVIAWTREVRPGKGAKTDAKSGGAIVHMTWDQFNAMRALADPKP